VTDAAVKAMAGAVGIQRAVLDPASAQAAARGQEPSASVYLPGDGADGSEADPDAALLAALREAPRAGLSADELAARLGHGRTWVYKRLSANAEAGNVVRLRRGRWAATRRGTRRER
jgi:hypothetical protein